MVMLTLLALLGLHLFITQLNGSQNQVERVQRTTSALAEAKQALIGDALAQTLLKDTVYLRLPDLGTDGFGVPSEGSASANFAGNAKNLSVVGKFPAKTFATTPLRDQQEECLWYVVSGRFKITPKTDDALNWDTAGQIDIIDGSGNTIATNLVGLIVSPGRPLDGQVRSLADPGYTQCGGNYDARNYLDAYDNANAISGEVNYFAGSTNNRVAANSNNKRLVMTDSEHFNDRFVFITTDDIFTPLIRRNDFSTTIASMLDHPAFQIHLQSVPVTGAKGTGSINCSNAPDSDFCENWREMLFLTELSPPSPITINDALSPVCSRILIFSGRKITGQTRNSVAEKADKNNFLENTAAGANATSFNVPTANAADFAGTSAFDWRIPGADLVRCLP